MSVPKKYSGRPTRRGPLRPQRAPARPVAPAKKAPVVEPEVKEAAPAPVPAPPAPEPEPVVVAEPEPVPAPEPEVEEVAWKPSMKKAELLSIAAELGLEVTESNKKAEILDALDGTRT